MKIAYICNMNIDDKGAFGIKSKIFSQVKTFQLYGINSDLCYGTNNGVQIIKNGIKQTFNRDQVKFRNKQSFFTKVIIEHLDINEYQGVYIRLDYLSYELYSLLKYLQSSKIKILLEIPTFPYRRELWQRSFQLMKEKNIVLAAKYLVVLIEDGFFRRPVAKRIDRLITFSRDDKIWGVPTIQISNAIDTKTINQKSSIKKSRSESINMIAVSTLNYWHGYDRLIRGLAKYYNEQKIKLCDVNLYIAGDGSEKQKYEELVSNLNLEKHVFFLGMLNQRELDFYYDKADLAIDSLGRHRVGVHYNSSLKGKEYLAKGLPVVSGVKTELDYFDNINFYYRCPADETDVNIPEVLEFYNVLTTKYVNREEMENSIRKFAIYKFDFSNAFIPVINYFKG